MVDVIGLSLILLRVGQDRWLQMHVVIVPFIQIILKEYERLSVSTRLTDIMCIYLINAIRFFSEMNHDNWQCSFVRKLR